MQIVKGSKPEPADTFKKDMLLTVEYLNVLLAEGQINKSQHTKLVGEVYSDQQQW